MKRSGRTLKQRLYGLKNLPTHLRRAQHFRGHGIHSPYVYDIVRKVFMQRELVAPSRDLYDALEARGVAIRRCTQLQNLVAHCKYSSWAIDSEASCDLIVCSLATTFDHLERYAEYARERGATLCILAPYNNADRLRVCRAIVAGHRSTSIDNRAYLLVFNNHLPRQRFIL